MEIIDKANFFGVLLYGDAFEERTKGWYERFKKREGINFNANAFRDKSANDERKMNYRAIAKETEENIIKEAQKRFPSDNI